MAAVTTTGHLPIQLHAAAEFAFGIALAAAAFALGLGPAATGAGVVAGIALATLALSATEPGGRGSLPASAHAAYDHGIGYGLVGAAVAFLVAGSPGAFGLFLAAGAIQLALAFRTRYAARA